ncbi:MULTISPECIES: hypothetical protein [unclassified Sphingomonas]|uniref:helix-turn-helix domain-containing protein n=1 Tax=unclassified Sphingomonas TaxID=196159 RepID=UPI00226AE54A|nr:MULTISPECIES: hypothetical protein [unclassified Sphingomonas]
MTYRKGERAVAVRLDTWYADHPVADVIASGTPWFDAWLGQKTTPIAMLSKRTGITGARLMTIAAGDRLSRAELDALARAWSISAGDLIASIGGSTVVVD